MTLVSDPEFPTSWVTEDHLRDGREVTVRPITPEDGVGLRAFHGALSDTSIYLRYFAPHPELSDADVSHLTRVDYRNRVALVAVEEGDIVGVGRFDRIDELSAEVAFLVRDDHQGHGLGSALFRHLVDAARDRGFTRFVAEVLPQNGRMMTTFAHSGLPVQRHYEDGVVRLDIELSSTSDARMNG